jgi:hypothetical protein
MSSKTPYRFNEIDINNITYTDIKNNNKKTVVYIKYDDNNKFKNLVFQTPSMISINSVQNKNNIFELDVPLIGKEQQKISPFIDFLNKLDKKIIKDAKNNNKWFEKFANVRSMKYQKTIRESVDERNKNGVLRLKLLRTDDFETLVQNNNTKINIEDINKDCWLKCILEIYAIWINPNGFGLFIRPILLSFTPCMKIAYNYKIIDDSEDEGEMVIDTVNELCSNDNSSVFIRSESEITSSILELLDTPNKSERLMSVNEYDNNDTNHNNNNNNNNNNDNNDNNDNMFTVNSSDEPVENNELNSSTSSDN